MKDYKAIAKAWISGLEEKVAIMFDDKLEETVARELVVKYGEGLGDMLQAAYDDGVLTQQSEPKEPAPPEVILRREDELLRKTEKILGSEARTHRALMMKPHKLRAVATFARVDPRVFRDFLNGQRTPDRVASMIRRTLRQLGYPTEPGAPS